LLFGENVCRVAAFFQNALDRRLAACRDVEVVGVRFFEWIDRAASGANPFGHANLSLAAVKVRRAARHLHIAVGNLDL
jgi:hypothetical protein